MALDNFFNRMGGARVELDSTTELEIDGMVYVLPPDFNKGDSSYMQYLRSYLSLKRRANFLYMLGPQMISLIIQNNSTQ